MVSQKHRAKKEDFAIFTQQPISGGINLTREQRTKNLTTFTSITFMTGLAVGIFNVFLNPYFLEIKNSVKLIGIILGLSNLSYVLGLLLSNSLYEKIGYKAVLAISFIINSFGFLIFTFSPQEIIPYKIVWIIIAIFLLYFGFALSEAPFNILLTESAGEKKKGKFTAIISIASRVGEIIIDFLIPFIAYYIIYTNLTRAYFFIASTGLYVISSILIIFYITNTSKSHNNQVASEKLKTENSDSNTVKNETSEPNNQQKVKHSNGVVELFIYSVKDKWTRRLSLIFFLDALIWSIGSGVYFAGLLDENLLGVYHFTDQTLGILMLIFNITVLIFQFPAGWITDRVGAKVILIVAEVLGILWGITTIIFIFFPMHFWIVVISRIILGIHVAFWIPSSIVITTNVPIEKKSKVYNALAIYRTIGFIPGGFIAAYIYDYITLPYGYVTSFFIFIAGLALLTPIYLTISNRPMKDVSINEKSA